MAPVMLVVDMGVHDRRSEKKVKNDLINIPGVMEVIACLVTGHVAIVGNADAATLREQLEARLSKPVFVLANFGSVPAPPVGGGYGAMPPPWPAPSSHLQAPHMVPPPYGYGYRMMPPPYGYGYGAMPPPSPAPSSRLPVPPMSGYYNPYVHYSPFRGIPWGPHYARNDAHAVTFEHEDNKEGCCCSIQ